MGLRYKHAHVSVPSLGVTAKLPIISVKKNPYGLFSPVTSFPSFAFADIV